MPTVFATPTWVSLKPNNEKLINNNISRKMTCFFASSLSLLCTCVYITYTQIYVKEYIYIYTHTHTHTLPILLVVWCKAPTYCRLIFTGIYVRLFVFIVLCVGRTFCDRLITCSGVLQDAWPQETGGLEPTWAVTPHIHAQARGHALSDPRRHTSIYIQA
jgi:hypothetical protein